MAAEDALMQAMRESCGQLCSNESLIAMDEISAMYCNLRSFTY